MWRKLSRGFAERSRHERREPDWKAVEDTVRGVQGTCGSGARQRAVGWPPGQRSRGGSRCQVAMHRSLTVISVHKSGARLAAAESARVAGEATAARTGPQRCRRSNPAARHIWNPAREGADVHRRRAQAFARMANCKVLPQLLPATNVVSGLTRAADYPAVACPTYCGIRAESGSVAVAVRLERNRA